MENTEINKIVNNFDNGDIFLNVDLKQYKYSFGNFDKSCDHKNTFSKNWDDLDYYEPDFHPDLDFCFDESELWFLEENLPNYHQLFSKLNENYKTKIEILLESSQRIKKMIAHQKITNNLMYKGKVNQNIVNNTYFISRKLVANKNSKTFSYKTIPLKSNQDRMDSVENFVNTNIISDYFSNLLSFEKYIISSFNRNLLEQIMGNSPTSKSKEEKFEYKNNFKKIKTLENNSLKDCIYLYKNYFLFYLFSKKKFSFKIKQIDFKNLSQKSKCKN